MTSRESYHIPTTIADERAKERLYKASLQIQCILDQRRGRGCRRKLSHIVSRQVSWYVKISGGAGAGVRCNPRPPPLLVTRLDADIYITEFGDRAPRVTSRDEARVHAEALVSATKRALVPSRATRYDAQWRASECQYGSSRASHSGEEHDALSLPLCVRSCARIRGRKLPSGACRPSHTREVSITHSMSSP